MFGGKQLYVFTYNTEIALTSNADKYTWYIPFRCRPLRAGVTVTTVTSGAATVKFDRAPIPGTDTSRGDGDCGMIVIPTGTAVGYVVYDNTNYYYGITAATAGNWCQFLDEGESLVFQLTSAASSGGVVPWLLVEIDPEQPGNNAVMSAST